MFINPTSHRLYSQRSHAASQFSNLFFLFMLSVVEVIVKSLLYLLCHNAVYNVECFDMVVTVCSKIIQVFKKIEKPLVYLLKYLCGKCFCFKNTCPNYILDG